MPVYIYIFILFYLFIFISIFYIYIYIYIYMEGHTCEAKPAHINGEMVTLTTRHPLRLYAPPMLSVYAWTRLAAFLGT